jgi:hypothetical protein
MMRKLCLVAACAAVLASPVAVLAQSPDQAGTAPLPSFDARWYVLPYAAYTSLT